VFIRGQKRDIVREGKKCAELRAEYFASMKFSTHVLKSLWKSAALRHLTSLPSTPCCGLHQFSASFLVSSRFQVNKRAPCRNSSETKILGGEFQKSQEVLWVSIAMRSS